ncbi:MAG: glycoside hydrolase family 9 protein [Myxococcota bacterium]
MRRFMILAGLLGSALATGCPAPKQPRPTVPRNPEPATTPTVLAEVTGCEMSAEPPPDLPGVDPESASVRVNQIGYLPEAPKHASLANGAIGRLPWALRNQAGQVVARGATWVLGDDRASGDHVHEADFSCVKQPGFGYRLQINDQTSPPFAIGPAVYTELRAEAFGYFYRHRSGVALQAAFTHDATWALPPGHPADADVTCHPRAPCEYRLDASGGWYGDGSMAKYTVGSALAVWTLQNAYERLVVRGKAVPGDGALSIPETGNGKPDILDGARWHLEWMLSMQVPATQRGAGLVHHKLHGDDVPEAGVTPDKDTTARALRPPSTAATLNLVAVAAQAARVWSKHDPAFAKRCLDAAERGFEAARVSGMLRANAADSLGGLPFVDDDATDEVFWAAAELALTTQDKKYVDVVENSPWFGGAPPESPVGPPPIIDWDLGFGPAMLDLLLVDGPFGAEDIEKLRTVLRDVADGYLEEIGRGGYRTTMQRQTYGDSTVFDMLHNAMVLTYAFDLTQEPRFRSGAFSSVEWILGRNPLGQVFVTGFGAQPVEHPVHQYWSENPPPGMVVNGPNGNTDDPFAGAEMRGCSQQKCYMDNAAAISTNRVADRGNAALVWVLGAVAE